MLSSAINIEEFVEDLIKIICCLHKDCGILETSAVPEFIKYLGHIRNH